MASTEPRPLGPPRSRNRGLLLAAWGLLVLVPFLAACGGEDWTPGGEPWDPDSPRAREILEAPEVGSPVDREMAEAGEQWYRRLGCAACHTLGQGHFQGPDLLGVTLRREYDWFRGMVMRPDSMLRWDAEAQRLAGRFRVPMPDVGASELQSRALWEYLREVDQAP